MPQSQQPVLQKLFYSLLLIMLLVSCTAESEPVSVAELPGLELDYLFTVSESDDLLLGSITYVLTDSEGNMIISDMQQRTIHAVDAEGNYIQQIGGRGSGPGEYQFPGILTLGSDDTLQLLDWGTRKVTSYRKESGRWIFDTDFIADFSETGFFSSLHADGGGHLAVAASPTAFDSEGGKTVIKRLNSHGEVVSDSILAYPSPERFTIMQDGMPRMSMTNPLMHRQGRFHVDLAGNYYYGWTDSLYIERKRYDEDDFKPYIHFDMPKREFTSAIADSLENSMSSMLEDNNQARRDLRASFPAHVPAFSTLMADDMGYLWVSVFDEAGRPEWVIFDDDGQPAFKTTLPERHRLGALRHGRAYLIAVDEFDLPVVKVMAYSYR
jgi:hypothetical protein